MYSRVGATAEGASTPMVRAKPAHNGGPGGCATRWIRVHSEGGFFGNYLRIVYFEQLGYAISFCRQRNAHENSSCRLWIRRLGRRGMLCGDWPRGDLC